MDAATSQVLAIGVVAVLASALLLVLAVQFELAPAAGLAGRQRLLLIGAFGLGTVAFTIKLAVLGLLSQMSWHPAPPPPALSDSAPAMFAPRPATAGGPGHYVWRALPDRAPDPAANPTTPEKVALGRRLFADPNLSADRTISCASCHELGRGAGADGRAVSRGVGGASGRRNAPSVYNAAFQALLFWDGRTRSLEEQAIGPILDPAEMAMPDVAAVENRVRADPAYPPLFAAAFGSDGIDIGRIAAVIAAFERTLITADAPYDRFVRGDAGALTPAQLRGMALFQEARCIACHSGPNFSAASVFPTDGGMRLFPALDSPLAAGYRLTDDAGAAGPARGPGVWRIPSLRNVALTAPYFHNGSVDNLAEAVRIMASAQRNAVIADDPRAGRRIGWDVEAGALATTDRLVLSERDISDLVAFLHALSSDALVRGDR